MLISKVSNIVVYDYLMNCRKAYDELSIILNDLQKAAKKQKVNLNVMLDRIWDNSVWFKRFLNLFEILKSDYKALFSNDFLEINFQPDKEIIQQAIKEIDRFIDVYNKQAVIAGYYRNGKWVKGYTRRY